jgi:nicotinamidase/pyrazinamidase
MTVEVVFWDVDTQVDFIHPDGKLYIEGAENLKQNLEKLTQFARMNNIRILGSVDYHTEDDPEIVTENPDFEKTFPPHCMVNDPGQEKIIETRSDLSQWIDSETYSEEKLERIIATKGPIMFRKSGLTAFDNPNLMPVMGMMKPQKIVIYGVAIDFCVKGAIEGFLNFGNLEIFLVIDAIEGVNEEESRRLIEDWIQKGVHTVTTEAVLQGYI